MRWTLWLIIFVFVMQMALAQSQLFSRLLNRFLFKSRHSEEDDHPRYSPRRRPPPRRRYHRRPSDGFDPFKYDPDDEDYHKEHALPRPPRRPVSSQRMSYRHRSSPPHYHRSNEQDHDDSSPPMTIYLQPGQGGVSKPRRIRVVTLDSPIPQREPEYPYPRGSNEWNRNFIHRDPMYSGGGDAAAAAARRRVLYVDYNGNGPRELNPPAIVMPRPLDLYASGPPPTRDANSAAVLFPDTSSSYPNLAGRLPSEGHSDTAGHQIASTTTPTKFDYDYYRKKRKK